MKNFLLFIAFGFACAASAQTSMLSEFQAMPAMPATAKGAYSISKINISADKNYSYKGNSDAVTVYQQRIQNEIKPYTDIITAKGKAGIAPGMGAASDFSDLTSPEVQAKLAKMTQEEKIKFAMEVQARMNSNKNLQAVSATNKPSPMTGITTALGQSYQKIVATFTAFTAAPFNGYSSCPGLCNGDNDPNCEKKIQACESKASHSYYATETARYAELMKKVQADYAVQKKEFEAKLKEFDTAAAKYSKEDIAGDYSVVLGWIGGIAGQFGDYEQKGAELIVSAKNNVYVTKEY